MTPHDSFDRVLSGWLVAEAPAAAPASLHPASIEQARRRHQRPGWLVSVRGRAFGGGLVLARPGLRLAYVAVVLAILLALLAALAIGALRSTTPPPFARNGAIAIAIQDIKGRPYNHTHLLNPDGTGDREIGQGSCPMFSADGTRLTYKSGWDDITYDTASFVIAAADGSSPEVVPGIRFGEGVLSPDGTKVAWLKPLTPVETTSPDGGSTTSVQMEVWVTPVDGGPAIRVSGSPKDAHESFWSPVWSPDSRLIAFAVMVNVVNGDNQGSYRSAIDVVDADGSNRRRLTGRPGDDAIGISWSPDGRVIAYVGLPDGSPLPSLAPGGGPPDTFFLPQDLFVIDADGANDRNLTRTPTFEGSPAWSPDGRHLAYQDARFADGSRLTVLEMSGSVVVHAASDSSPSNFFTWSPDGTKLLVVRSVVTDGVAPPQTFQTTIQTINAELGGAPSTLLELAHSVGCAPSWQRLQP